eukprot:25943-Pelagococcus_subviridis.AAC.3
MDDDDYGFDDMDALIDQDDGGGDVDEEEMMMMMDDEDDGGGGDGVGATQRGVGSAQMAPDDAARAQTQTQTQGGGIAEDDLDFLANAGATQRPGGDASTGVNAAANDAAFPDDDDDAAAMDDDEEEEDPQCETWEPHEPAPLLSNARRDAPRTTATAIVDGIPVAVTAADGRRAFVRAEYSQSGAGGGGGGGGGTDAADVSFRGAAMTNKVRSIHWSPYDRVGV